jgi:hypothetical protein
MKNRVSPSALKILANQGLTLFYFTKSSTLIYENERLIHPNVLNFI